MEERNENLELARKVIEKTGSSLFLTGKAGTGKTTFLRELRSQSRKRMVVAAPTGIAAINAGGVTLHSFFQIDFGPFVPNARPKSSDSRRRLAFSKEKISIIRGLDLLVIDEVSMVRADMLDAIDEVLRRFRDRTLPFGGVQLLLIGDLQQLPPVVMEAERELMRLHYESPYFFDSHALKGLDYLTIELSKVYRQEDSHFIELLNAVRDNRADNEVLRQLNSRFIPDFREKNEGEYVRLTTHNHKADEINSQRLAELPGKPTLFKADIKGTFSENSYPADRELKLKVGAQVMFIKNDVGTNRKYFNGMIGTVTAIGEDGVSVSPSDGYGNIIVNPVEWENLKFVVNEETNEITEKIDGVFRQLPLKLAWAITIHKSQGLTFDKAIIDTSMSFTHGQTYVALSRCRSLKGIVLERPISPAAIITDRKVSNFLETHLSGNITEKEISSLAHTYYIRLIGEMFNFRPIFNMAEGIDRIFKENFSKIYPSLVLSFSNTVSRLRTEMVDVGDKFQHQIARIDAQQGFSDNNALLAQRIKDGANYFLPRLHELADLVDSLPTDHDNKNILQKFNDRIDMFFSSHDIRSLILDIFSQEEFSIDRYLDVKAKATFTSKKRKKAKSVSVSQYSTDNVHPQLFDMLAAWRRNKAEEKNTPAFTVASTKTLLAVSNYLPTSYDDLLMLPGIGAAIVKKYGDDMLAIVERFVDDNPDKIVRLPYPKPSRRRHQRLK